jgi:hypothetical protein
VSYAGMRTTSFRARVLYYGNVNNMPSRGWIRVLYGNANDKLPRPCPKLLEREQHAFARLDSCLIRECERHASAPVSYITGT